MIEGEIYENAMKCKINNKIIDAMYILKPKIKTIYNKWCTVQNVSKLWYLGVGVEQCY